MYTYRKNETYYSELYDKHTIDECRGWEARAKETVAKRKPEMPKDAEEELRAEYAVTQFSLFFIKGERYRHKSETVREWMNRDRDKDDQLARAMPPTGIRCLGCSSIMDPGDPELMTYHETGKELVVFMFECPKCHKRRAYWENGEEWRLKPTPCPKCQTPMKSTDDRKGNVITTTYTCPHCGYKETDKLELNKHHEEKIDPNFEADRKKYCLSDKEGGEYISSVDNTKAFLEQMKDREDNKEAYEAVAKINKLAIADIKSLLGPLMQKAGYGHLEISPPDLRRGVSVDFKIEDVTPGRPEYESKHKLEKLIKKALAGTNWHLMTEGIMYRLGFLNGRLRGVEGEDELLELAKRNMKKMKK